ncbi:hypothetical protein ACPCSE_30010 [Streptomyces cellulosae]
MRKAWAAVAAAVVMCSTAACGSGDQDEQGAPPPGARTCSDWAGRMDESEQWDAAEELMAGARAVVEEDDGEWAPSSGAVKQFQVDLGFLCDREDGDELLGRVSVQLFRLNKMSYTL